MSQTTPSHFDKEDSDDLLPEYDFDYSQAKKNRFAKSNQAQLIVTIDPDQAIVRKNNFIQNPDIHSYQGDELK